MKELLKRYHKLCDKLEFDYEFNYVSDIENNEGAEQEIKTFLSNYGGELNCPTCGTGHIRMDSGTYLYCIRCNNE